jgi:hypothetical protein
MEVMNYGVNENGDHYLEWHERGTGGGHGL